MIVAVTGSTGLIGSALVSALEADGHLVRRVVRRPAHPEDHDIRWDPAAGTIDAVELSSVDAIVHLAGANVAGRRWTAAYKAQIRDSRVLGTRLLCKTIAGMLTKPAVFVSASAVGYYGDRGEEELDETSPPGSGFLADVCQQWESETAAARDAGVRVVNLRFGVVLSRDGGALAQMLIPFRMGVGGVLGSGRQYISWIALDDAVRAIEFVLQAAALTGPVNAVAPNPVTNRQFTEALGRVVGRPTILPMPAFAARMAFGEMADEMLLSSARALPRALENVGFAFQHPQLEPALRDILGRTSVP
jgi:uncharacterized protein (TIGR01777 family)